MERALTRFMAKTGETQSLFKDDVTAFPCKDMFKSNCVGKDLHAGWPCFCVCLK